MLQFNFFYLYCTQNLKANHNKDYSVVKTFRAAPSQGSFSFSPPRNAFLPEILGVFPLLSRLRLQTNLLFFPMRNKAMCLIPKRFLGVKK